jgi:hypothetical protein
LGVGGLGVGVERVSSRHRGLPRAMALHLKSPWGGRCVSATLL